MSQNEVSGRALFTIAIPVASGALATLVLYDPTHRDGFPECGRYGVGMAVIAACGRLLGRPWRWVYDLLGLSALVGCGVVAARLWLGYKEATDGR